MRKMRLARLCGALSIACVMLVANVASVSAADPTFTFKGDGLGHGIGLSQLGAVGLAKAGWKSSQIISYYYKGAIVEARSVTKRVLVHLDSSKAARTSWTIRPGYHGGILAIDDAAKVRTYYPDDFYTFTSTTTGIKMTSKSGKTPPKTFTGSIHVVADTSMPVALNQIVDPSGPLGNTNMRYRGYFILTPQSSKVRLLNSVSMDQYLYGVVPRELGDFYNPLAAASEAQAIVARSYAYPKVVAGTTLACTTSDQVYGGHSRFSSEENRIKNAPSKYEETNANNAVKETSNLVVTYGGSVIATYFSACNGAYTANNSDIWGGTQKPYYSSVKDGFCSHSDHAWTKTYDGTSLAVQIDRKTTAPAGAGTTVHVTALAPTYGTNGWVKALKVSWSNGQVTTINLGDNVRIALGLRSARFTVSASAVPGAPVPPVTPTPTPTPTPAPSAPTAAIKRYEEGSGYIRRSGTWKAQAIAGNSGNKIRTATTLNAYFQVRFKGSEITWVGPKATTYGRAKVYVDGVYKKTVNLKASKTYRQQVLYRISGLDPAKTHTLKVVVTTASGSSKARTVGLDRIDIRGQALYSASKAYAATSSVIRRSSGWSILSEAGHYSGKAIFTRKLSKTATTKVYGEAFTIYGQKSPKGGRAKIYINGVYKKTVSFKSTRTLQQAAIYSASGLDPSRTNTIRIVAIAKSGSRSPGHVVIDRISVRGGGLK